MEKPTLLSNSSPEFREIIRLTTENEKLAAEVAHLKNLLQHNATVLNVTETRISHDRISNEELLCIEQITLLRNTSKLRELTLEETKKVDVCVKMLEIIRGRSKKPNDTAAKKTLDELLAKVNDE